MDKIVFVFLQTKARSSADTEAIQIESESGEKEPNMSNGVILRAFKCHV